jgi:hypothetical protein
MLRAELWVHRNKTWMGFSCMAKGFGEAIRTVCN